MVYALREHVLILIWYDVISCKYFEIRGSQMMEFVG